MNNVGATELVARHPDCWRRCLLRFMQLSDDPGNHYAAITDSLRSMCKLPSTMDTRDVWRLGLCAAMKLPKTCSDEELVNAFMIWFDNAHPLHGYAPIFSQQEGNVLELNSAEDAIRQQLGFTRFEWFMLP